MDYSIPTSSSNNENNVSILGLSDERRRGPSEPVYKDQDPVPNLAEDECDGLSSCPTAINCQLSLLAYERTRELEVDILSGLHKLIFEQGATGHTVETLFIIYTVLTLLMDAYESYAIAFEVRRPYFGNSVDLLINIPSVSQMTR